jgi:hypothetical protein
MDWKKEVAHYQNIEWMQHGNARQKSAFRALQGVLPKIPKKYKPTLAGTIPIKTETENSDLDIICTVYEPDAFRKSLETNFSEHQNFRIHFKTIRGVNSLICRFDFSGQQIEIFGQPRPVHEQHAFRHMIIEREILACKNQDFRAKIIHLKKQGLSTEAAFANSLNILGDPFEELLKFDSQEKIAELCSK